MIDSQHVAYSSLAMRTRGYRRGEYLIDVAVAVLKEVRRIFRSHDDIYEDRGPASGVWQ
jgi:hypothetical protein